MPETYAEPAGTFAEPSGFNRTPATVKRRFNFGIGKRFLLGALVPNASRFLSGTPREMPREAGEHRPRDVERRKRIFSRIAATPRPGPLRKRKALLAAKCMAAGVRNAAGLWAVKHH